MFDFLKPDFQNTTAQALKAPSSTTFNSTLQDTGNAEALIQTVWKDLERLYKLPAGAVVCEVMPAPKSSTRSSKWVQLTVMQWSEPLALHMFVLQKLLITGLDSYEPGVDHENITIVWRLDKQCGCPQTDIPEQTDWAAL